LGRRLVAAFLVAALSSVAVLTLAALVATNQGLASAQRSERQQVADRTASAVATAYIQAGGWTGADLSEALAISDAAGARLAVENAGSMTVSHGHGMGPGAGGMQGAAAVVESPVIVGGERVGTVRLGFSTATSSGRTVAWSWVIGAAAVALVAALLISGYVVRRLTRPLAAMTGAAQRFAAGDRTARAAVDAPGELGEMAGAFDRMADEVVRTEGIRRQLAADVAHEIRTPLAALQAGLEELRDGLRPADSERLGALHDQALRLGRIVQDLADLSAAESAALSLHPSLTDLSGIAAAALAEQQAQLDAAGLRVRADLATSTPVFADADRLHQAVTNLLSNAARYCRPGDQVSLSSSIDGVTAVLEIADTGPGIPADELPQVFDRLWRGQQARAVAGSGIGLAVVRELVTAHGGTVTARSPAGSGAIITVRLPLSPAPAIVRN
jgi:two-component system sensor histidine kinase BaeS